MSKIITSFFILLSIVTLPRVQSRVLAEDPINQKPEFNSENLPTFQQMLFKPEATNDTKQRDKRDFTNCQPAKFCVEVLAESNPSVLGDVTYGNSEEINQQSKTCYEVELYQKGNGKHEMCFPHSVNFSPYNGGNQGALDETVFPNLQQSYSKPNIVYAPAGYPSGFSGFKVHQQNIAEVAQSAKSYPTFVSPNFSNQHSSECVVWKNPGTGQCSCSLGKFKRAAHPAN